MKQRVPVHRTTLLAARRLSTQQLARHAFAAPGDLVAWLGAVQAQDYGAAKWALGIRLPPGSGSEVRVEQALADGTVLRTHALRGTWQLVAPADIRWILALAAPRVLAGNATRYRELGLEAPTLRRSNDVLANALRAGEHLTRAELAAALGAAGISTAGQRLAYLLQRAELEGLACSGSRRGKQSTYALLDDRAPRLRAPLRRDETIAELARRYFRSRGPATVGDFMWWSGLSSSEARAGLEAIDRALVSDAVDGQTFWRSEEGTEPAASPTAYLLPAFDEYLIAYRDRAAVLDPKHAKSVNAGNGMLGPFVVLDGRVIGTWRRVLARDGVAIELSLLAALASREHRAIAGAARRYGTFLGLDARVAVRPIAVPRRGGRRAVK